MTDAQILVIGITVLAVLAGSLFNNVRLGDTNDRIRDAKELLRAEFKAELAAMRLEFTQRFDSIDRKLDEILRIVGGHETRIVAFEQRPR